MKISSLDIVIPSYRIDPCFLVPIFNLKKPKNFLVNYYLIADNPKIKLSDIIKKFLEKDNIHLIINKENLGAHLSRNAGIEHGNGEWILFLDDDIIPDKDLIIEYHKYILNNTSDSVGAIGVTKFPKPINSFTKGVIASDILTFFDLSELYSNMTWGVTANILISRKDLDSMRFSREFPKFGGGEDIDLFIRVTQKAKKKFESSPKAKVTHPWWKNGARSYSRFFRWAYGDSLLPIKYPFFKYYNFPNVIESLILGIIMGTILSVFFKSFFILGSIIIGIIIGEIAVEYIAGYKLEPRIDLSSIPSAVYTEPQIGSFGITENKAIETGIKYKKATFPYRGNGKAVASGNAEGMAKVLFDPETKDILGAHIVGQNATELIHEILLAKTAKLTPGDIGYMIHAHPTLSELIMEVMRAVEGKSIHI